MTTPAVLVLEDGRMFRGTGFGAEGATFGEAVFCTAMTGYQETLSVLPPAGSGDDSATHRQHRNE